MNYITERAMARSQYNVHASTFTFARACATHVTWDQMAMR